LQSRLSAGIAGATKRLPGPGLPPLWLVDLDNTLYDASWRVMGEINQRMTRYVADHLNLPLAEASAVRERYWKRYGATLLGLVRHHQISALDFLHRTHPREELIDFVRRIKGERARIKLLKGRRWLLTNAPRDYALHLLALMGLRHLFERVISIEEMKICGQFRPKPSGWVWRHVTRLSGFRAGRLALIDDSSENLRAAHRHGIKTARIFASQTMLARARASGRPLQIRRPSYVRVQVHSLESLARQQHRLYSQ